jgi:hypothetical protein
VSPLNFPSLSCVFITDRKTVGFGICTFVNDFCRVLSVNLASNISVSFAKGVGELQLFGRGGPFAGCLQ